MIYAALNWVVLPGCQPQMAKSGQLGEPRLLPPVDHWWRQQITFGPLYWELAQFEFAEPSLLPSQGIVVGGLGNDVVALSWSGNELWRTTRNAPTLSPLLATSVPGLGDVVFAGSLDGQMCALKARQGTELWCHDSAASILARPSLANDFLIFSNEADQVFAVDARTGEFRWRKERKVLTADFTVNGHGAPLVHDGVVYAGFSDGFVAAHALSDGQMLWSNDLSGGEKRFRDADATPSLSDGKLFVASYAGGLYALDPKTGQVLWRRAEVRGASEVVTKGHVLYFSALDGIHAADPATGADLWKVPLPEGALPARPVVDDRAIFVSLRRQGLLILDRGSGRAQGLVNPGGGFSAPPLVTPQAVFAFSNRGALFAYRRAP
jgi:outer membrane protein assembly factor BamB